MNEITVVLLALFLCAVGLMVIVIHQDRKEAKQHPK